MPFESEAQRRYMWKFHPRIARRWAEEYGTPKNLPYHKRKKKKHNKETKQEKKSQYFLENKMSSIDFKAKVINLIETVDQALQEAAAIVQEKQAAENNRQALINYVVDALIQYGRIYPEEREAAYRALQDHNKTLELLAKTAAHVPIHYAQQSAPQNSLGRPQRNGKVARSDHIFIEPRDSTPEADKIFYSRLGLSSE